MVLATQPNSDVLAFIRDGWADTVRSITADDGRRIGLPYPYTVPCKSGMFQTLFYWDTFYTNTGLIATGEIVLARQNTENILSLIERFGFYPNGNQVWFLGRSQPPHAALMVRDVYKATGDQAWLRAQLPALEREHDFWMTKRLAPNGLNHYGTHDDPARSLHEYRNQTDRLGRPVPDNDAAYLKLITHDQAECESGWDYCARFDRRCADFCPVDLNALLYAHEQFLSSAHEQLGDKLAAARWKSAAEKRAALMRRHLWSHDLGAFTDVNFKTGEASPILSAAVFYPLWLGVANPAEAAATVALLPRLETPHGLLCAEPGPRKFAYQWDAPNGWPPLHYATVHALLRTGYAYDARRLAGKYMTTLSDNFERTGELWEKYNVADGTTEALNEYAMPAMLGWTAGVFAAFSADPTLKSDS